MADLSDLTAATTVKVVGANTSGIEQTPVNSSAQGDLFVKDVMNVIGVQGVIALSTTATEVRVGVSKLTGRKCVTILPTNGTIYFGYTAAVTTTNGTPIYKGQLVTFGINDTSTIFIIAAGSVDVRITEG